MNSAVRHSIGALIARARGEYLEMPGLRLTEAQARRLWALDNMTCREILSRLLEAQFLARTSDGYYRRADEIVEQKTYVRAGSANGRSPPAASSSSQDRWTDDSLGKEELMMPQDVAAGIGQAGSPRNGDVVIGRGEKRGKALYRLCAVPGPDQLCCETREKAERLAFCYAKRARVDVWMAESPVRFVILACCRESRGIGSPADQSASGASGIGPLDVASPVTTRRR